MYMNRFFLCLSTIFFGTIAFTQSASQRQKISLDDNWKFILVMLPILKKILIIALLLYFPNQVVQQEQPLIRVSKTVHGEP